VILPAAGLPQRLGKKMKIPLQLKKRKEKKKPALCSIPPVREKRGRIKKRFLWLRNEREWPEKKEKKVASSSGHGERKKKKKKGERCNGSGLKRDRLAEWKKKNVLQGVSRGGGEKKKDVHERKKKGKE